MTTETATKPSKLRGCLKWTAIAFAGLVVLAILAPNRDSHPAVQPASVPAVAAPAPTEKPAPTAAPEPDVDIQMYARATAREAGSIASALSELSTLLQHPTMTDEWKIDVAVQLATIRTAHQNLLNMQAPANMQDVHSSLTNATSDCDAMTRHLARGIDTMDTAEIGEATRLMESCTRKIQITTELLKTK